VTRKVGTTKLKYTNLTGLLAILGFVASLVAIGMLYPINPLLAVPFALLAFATAALFVKFVYHYIAPSPKLAEQINEFLEPDHKK